MRWNSAASTLASVVEKWNPGSTIGSASFEIVDAIDIVFSLNALDTFDLGVRGISLSMLSFDELGDIVRRGGVLGLDKCMSTPSRTIPCRFGERMFVSGKKVSG